MERPFFQILNYPVFKATIFGPVVGSLAFLGITNRMSVFASKAGDKKQVCQD